MPVPDALAHDELAAIAATETAAELLSDARAAYDGRMLLTKGYELALRYPERWLRPFSDVDLLVDDSAEAQRALLTAGFIEVGKPSIFEDIHHLRPLWRPGSTGNTCISSGPMGRNLRRKSFEECTLARNRTPRLTIASSMNVSRVALLYATM